MYLEDYKEKKMATDKTYKTKIKQKIEELDYFNNKLKDYHNKKDYSGMHDISIYITNHLVFLRYFIDSLENKEITDE